MILLTHVLSDYIAMQLSIFILLAFVCFIAGLLREPSDFDDLLRLLNANLPDIPATAGRQNAVYSDCLRPDQQPSSYRDCSKTLVHIDEKSVFNPPVGGH